MMVVKSNNYVITERFNSLNDVINKHPKFSIMSLMCDVTSIHTRRHPSRISYYIHWNEYSLFSLEERSSICDSIDSPRPLSHSVNCP